jgi:hypothetical protein
MRRRFVVAIALLGALALGGCGEYRSVVNPVGPFGRETTNTSRGTNGSSVTSTGSVLKEGEKPGEHGEDHGGEAKPAEEHGGEAKPTAAP